MSYTRTLLALGVLAAMVLVGCREPVGLRSDRVRVADDVKESCYVAFNTESGHLDWYKGVDRPWDSYSWSWGSPITWAYYCYPGDSDRAYPRKNGYCVFTVSHFVGPGGKPATCVCTLYYYQTAHSGSASLEVNTWEEGGQAWPPTLPYDKNYYFWEIWNSTDVIATDAAHGTDNCWYKVALSSAACSAIAETAVAHPNGDGRYHTGWVYRDSVDGTYTDARGYDGYDNHAPFIRVWYDDGP